MYTRTQLENAMNDLLKYTGKSLGKKNEMVLLEKYLFLWKKKNWDDVFMHCLFKIGNLPEEIFQCQNERMKVEKNVDLEKNIEDDIWEEFYDIYKEFVKNNRIMFENIHEELYDIFRKKSKKLCSHRNTLENIIGQAFAQYFCNLEEKWGCLCCLRIRID